MDWKFEWVTSWDEVFSPGFQQQWQQYIDVSPTSHVFFHPALAQAWIETYLPIRDLKPLFGIARNGSAMVFLPLLRWRRNWKNACQRIVVPVGYSDYDYHDPLAIGGEDGLQLRSNFWLEMRQALFAVPGKAFDEVHIEGIRSELTTGSEGWTNSDVCPFIDIKAITKPTDFLTTLGRNLRRDLIKQRRRLEGIGTLQLHSYSPEQAHLVAPSLAQFLTFHAQRWPRAYKAPGFHENLIVRALPRGLIHFSELQLDGHVISWLLGFTWRDCFYAYKSAFDPCFSASSPTKVHLLLCIESCIAQRMATFDFLRGDESYKAGWTSESKKLMEARWAQNSLRSGLTRLALAVKQHAIRA